MKTTETVQVPTFALSFFKTDYFPIILLQIDYNLTVILEASSKTQSLNDHCYNYTIMLTNKVNASIFGSKENIVKTSFAKLPGISRIKYIEALFSSAQILHHMAQQASTP